MMSNLFRTPKGKENVNCCKNKKIDSTKEEIINVPMVDNTEMRVELIKRIESVALTMISQICSGQLPTLSCTSYTQTSNESQDKEDSVETEETDLEESSEMSQKYISTPGKHKIALMMAVMSTGHRLLIANRTITRRSFYYDLKGGSSGNLVREQRSIDQAVRHIANLLQCAPWDFGFVATSKGLAAGNMTLHLVNDATIDCDVPGGSLIPQIVTNVTSLRIKADFVLVVEKDTVFQELLEENCTNALNCILVTGKGYPDVATRMLVKLLSETAELPVYILVDADPFGLDIMCTYRFGSLNLSKEKSKLACPKARWLGVFPSELGVFGVKRIPLTAADSSKLMSIEGREYMNNEILEQVGTMHQGKAEIEALSCFSKNFLTSTYLPCKIKGKDYI